MQAGDAVVNDVPFVHQADFLFFSIRKYLLVGEGDFSSHLVDFFLLATEFGRFDAPRYMLDCLWHN